MERIVFGGVATSASNLKVYHSEIQELLPVIKSLLANVDIHVNQKRSFGAHPRAQGNTIQYLVQDDAVYFSAATPNFSHSYCFKFLESLARESKNVDLNTSKGSQQIEQWIKSEMKRNTEENSMDQLKTISKQVDSVKDLMISNIEQALNRGESLEKIKIKAEVLEEKSITFKKKTKSLKCAMIRENIKLTIILIAIFICIILTLVGLGVGLYFIFS